MAYDPHEYLELTEPGILPPGVDVDAIITAATENEHDLTAVWLTYFAYGPGSENPEGNPTSSPVEPLQALAASTRLIEWFMRFRPTVIDDARAAGKTWAEIGAALGMSAQGAIDHYTRQRELLDELAGGARNHAAAAEPAIADQPRRPPTAVRYTLYIPVPSLPEDDCDDLALQAIAHGPAVPRRGEVIELDGPQGRHLRLTVSEVAHCSSVGGAVTPPSSKVVVTAELDESSSLYDTARELLDLAAWKAWVDHFPTLELPENLRRAL